MGCGDRGSAGFKGTDSGIQAWLHAGSTDMSIPLCISFPVCKVRSGWCPHHTFLLRIELCALPGARACRTAQAVSSPHISAYALISHASKVMLKILQARLQQYVNHKLPDVQAGFRKGRRTRGQIANIRWIIKKAREFQRNIYFCFIDYAKDFDCVDHNKLWKILKEIGIPDHLTCLLRNLYAGQEATVRTGHGTTDWFQIGK